MISQETTTILIARHGECRGNTDGLFRGRMDFPLNDRGRIQAEELAGAIAPLRPTVLYSSPLLRAVETAEACGRRCSLPVLIEEGFNNISLGPWEGQPKTEIAREFPREWELWLKDPEQLDIEGGETLSQVFLRSMESLNRLVNAHRGETILILTHRTVIKPLLAGCLAIPSPWFWKTHTDTAAYSILHFDDLHGYSLYALNRTDHLSGFTTEWI
ncbi:MAG: histidine phosphatase family protein [Synergistaceae bacterium]|nr:histidine phosphatase family protein [Synergistaceae bacterium]